MLFRITGIIIMLALTVSVHAQSDVHFRLTDPQKLPAAYSTIQLTRVADSSRVKQLSDSLGRAVIERIRPGQYMLLVTSVGYQPYEKGITLKEGRNDFSIQLEAADGKLNTIVVTASKPLMRQEDDKTIVDPEALAASSTNSYEILEQTPGLFVDQEGNIYLNSTRPAMIFINGREQRMSAADIATMLKNLPPNAIASIEILRTPSSRYDASGSGGIVNVVLKKGVRIGLTGSTTLGMTQGRYGNQFVGLNLNNNNGRVTTYINLQVGRRNSFDRLETDRAFNVDSVIRQEAFTRFSSENFYVGYGVNLPLAPKWEFSYDGRISVGRQDNRSRNENFLFQKNSGQQAFTNITDVNNRISNLNINQGVNFKFKIDSMGSEWTTDASFTYSPNNTEQLFTIGDGDIDNGLKFFTAQSNYLKKLPNNISFETGVKTSAVWFRNQTDYFRMINGNRVKDNFRTGAFSYNENINSGYVQASKNFNGIILKMGTRVENTNMKGNQMVPTDTSFNIHRTDLFPYVYLSRNLARIAGYDLKAYLVYRRTLVRPAYEYLNPSIRFIDPFLFESGNPSLRPQFTNNYEANVSVDERPIFAFGVNETSDIFSQVIYPTDSTERVSYRTYDNLGTNRETYFRILGALPPGKRFFFVAGAQYNHNFYQGIYENNKTLSFKRGSWSVFTYQTFKITPNTQLTLNGFVRFKGQLQFYELSTFGQLNMSLTQQLFNRKLSLTLSGNDLLFTNNNQFIFNQGSINANGYRESDTRRIGLNLRYNFGFRKKEENNMFNIESPERSGGNNQ
jgi:iron complex outermembrane recepter protein